MRALLCLALLAASALPAAAADLSSAGPVYLWPMRGALDQYLASELTAKSLLTVTVDPATARTVMTDRVDQTFLEGMSEIFDRSEEKAAEQEESPASIESGALQVQRPPNAPQGRSQGTIFLVDVETRQVLWSMFIGELDNRPKKLHGEAEDVVSNLRKAMGVPD